MSWCRKGGQAVGDFSRPERCQGSLCQPQTHRMKAADRGIRGSGAGQARTAGGGRGTGGSRTRGLTRGGRRGDEARQEPWARDRRQLKAGLSPGDASLGQERERERKRLPASGASSRSLAATGAEQGRRAERRQGAALRGSLSSRPRVRAWPGSGRVEGLPSGT